MKSRIFPSSQCDQGSTEKVKPKCFRWEGTREISFMHEKRGWGLQGRSPARSSSQTGVSLGGDLGSPSLPRAGPGPCGNQENLTSVTADRLSA